MKKISIVVPAYNEEGNIVAISNAIINEVETKLPNYDYELIIIDNCSTDNTRPLIREVCKKNNRIKAILNAKNFGQFNSPYYAICQSTGELTVMISADFQDPVELIPVMVKEWESGYKIVCPIKTTDKENKIVYALRTMYYKMLKKFSTVDMLEHFTGFGLYDKSFVDVLRRLNDPTPFLRGIVAELGFKIKEIPYEHKKRASGRSHNNFYTLYDAAMLSFTSYTKIGLRIATFLGFGASLVCIIVALVYLILKLIYWDEFVAGNAAILIVMCFIGGLLLSFMGLQSEYILSMNTRIMNRPLVVEEERINFSNDKDA